MVDVSWHQQDNPSTGSSSGSLRQEVSSRITWSKEKNFCSHSDLPPIIFDPRYDCRLSAETAAIHLPLEQRALPWEQKRGEGSAETAASRLPFEQRPNRRGSRVFFGGCHTLGSKIVW